MALKPITVDQVHALRDGLEDDLLDVVSQEMRAWLLRVRAAVLRAIERPGGTALLAAAGDDMPTLGELAGWWSESVDNEIVLAVNAALDKAWAAWTDGTLVEASPAETATNSYIAAVRDRLVEGSHFGVPVYADSFNRIRESLAQSAAEGWTRPELAQNIAAQLSWEEDGPYWRDVKQQADDKIDNMLDQIGPPGSTAREMAKATDPRYKQLLARRNDAVKHLDAERSVWQTRAMLIARTEATGGANFGAFRALQSEGVATKVWEATGDGRTRISHAGASGQEVAIDRPFIVGGALLQFPGDPAGPASEVANCRCAMVGGDYFKAAPISPLEQAIYNPEAEAAAELAAVQKKWKGKPQPKPPKGAPEKPEFGKPASGSPQIQTWVAKVNTRYMNFSGKENLVYSGDFKVTEHMINATAASPTATRASALEGIDYLYNGKYLDDALRAEIMQIWEDASRVDPTVLEAYKRELALWKRRERGYKYALRDWRLANDVDESTGLGMDGARKFDTDSDGIDFASSSLPTARSGTESGQAVFEYTYDQYQSINTALHRKALNSSYRIPLGTSRRIEGMDEVMQPLGHDVYLHRGTNWDEFEFPDGHVPTVNYQTPPNPLSLLGTVQRQAGYLSTSIGTEPAFSGKPVHILFRASSTTKGTNVMEVSAYGPGEREIILQRGTYYFIHSVKQEHNRWLVEAEILDGPDYPSGMLARPLTTKVNHHGPSGS